MEQSTFTGNEFPIQKYRITIPEVNYSEEVEGNCSGSQCSHSITADGSDVRFNTPYLVEVTAVNTCNLESRPVTVNVTVIAYGEYSKIMVFNLVINVNYIYMYVLYFMNVCPCI